MAILRFKRLNGLLGARATLPEYQTSGAAGFDLCAAEEVVIEAGTWGAVSLGMSVEIQEGYEMQIRPRSGLALKEGITVLNSPGTVDSDYRGELKVILINHAPTPYFIEPGMRIAQGVVAKVDHADLVLVFEPLTKTERGDGGFGSTGV